ncbi:MAG: PHP domain-containing protein [bacterium]|nr:MAG: PHP domain-containing protein [bacterium]
MKLVTFRADLHLHTCLSPCADNEMMPKAIVNEARRKGLDIIGICDHNSTRNVAAVRRACGDGEVAVIGGVEVCSEEEVHILALFDEEESLHQMQQLIDVNLHGENNPEYFGEQLLCNECDDIIGFEDRMLIGATELTVEEIVENIHRFGGLAIASHVDREAFSLIGQLGFVPDGLEIDACEISTLHSITESRDSIPQISNYPIVRSSDAHRLEDIGRVSIAFTGTSPCAEELSRALHGENGREVVL